ncbi:unnamed protein product [Amaranthus hypochondriacus]
MKDSKED